MAAVKLYSEFLSSRGSYYKVEIWDEDYTGTSPDEFRVDGNGFELNYTGQTDNIYSPVIGSSISMGMYIRDAATRAFETSLKNYQENRYYIKIYRGPNDAGTTFFWGGYILQDVVAVEDASEPYILQISANDGIARLKDEDGPTSLSEIVSTARGAIAAINTFNIYETDDTLLKVISNWWSDAHTYNAAEQALETTEVDCDVFHSFSADGSVEKASYYEVLTGICRIFGLRFYFSDGSYRLEQLFQRDNSSITEFSYNKNGVLQGSSAVTRDKTIDQTTNKARLAGNIFNFLPAVNDVRIQTSENDLDYAGIVSTQNTSPLMDLGFTPGTAVNNFLEITFNYKVTMTANVTDNAQFLWYMFDVDVIQDDGTTVYYLERDHNKLTPLTQTWTTTQADGGYQVLAGRFVERSDLGFQFTTGTVTIVTPYLQTDGDITVQFNSNRFIKADGTTKVLNAGNSATWRTEVVSIRKSIGVNGVDIRSTTTNPDIDSGIIYNLGQTKIFDGPGVRGSLYKRNSPTSRTLTTGWREGNSGSYVSAQRLVCNEFLRLMNTPVKKYEGQFFSNNHFMNRLVFEGTNWLQLGGRYNANNDEWDGEWFGISRENITISNSDVGVPGDPVFSIGGNNGTGEINLAALDVNDFNAQDATVDNTVDIGGTLDVAGNSTLQNLDHQGTLIQEITDITNSSGSTYNVGDTEYMMFNTWTGGNGTATINLPRAGDNEGRLLRFKSDGTISSSKSIALTPSSPDTIDGDPEFIFNRDYDGVMLLAHNSNWFIIQRKAK
jgi:hypothetical protein